MIPHADRDALPQENVDDYVELLVQKRLVHNNQAEMAQVLDGFTSVVAPGMPDGGALGLSLEKLQVRGWHTVVTTGGIFMDHRLLRPLGRAISLPWLSRPNDSLPRPSDRGALFWSILLTPPPLPLGRWR